MPLQLVMFTIAMRIVVDYTWGFEAPLGIWNAVLVRWVLQSARQTVRYTKNAVSSRMLEYPRYQTNEASYSRVNTCVVGENEMTLTSAHE